MGASGGGSTGVGGAVATGFSPLEGGCSGGLNANKIDTGDGGGAIELVSLAAVTIEGSLDVSGAGGGLTGGGGAGGMVVIEVLRYTARRRCGHLIANGGGGGGACGTLGADGLPLPLRREVYAPTEAPAVPAALPPSRRQTATLVATVTAAAAAPWVGLRS